MKRHSFTLVELLIVVTIIGILAGLIIPAAGLARASARATQCQSNQSQTMKIAAQAMSENKDFLVSGSSFDKTPGKNPAWSRYLYGEGGDTTGDMKGRRSYLQNMTPFRCPALKYSDKEDLGALGDSKRAEALKGAFGMFYSSSTNGGKFNGFNFAGSKFLKTSGDTSFEVAPNSLLLGGCAVNDSSPYDEANALLGGNGGKLVKVHSDKTNVFFLDGHSEGLAQPELEKKYYPGSSSAEKFPSSLWVDPEK